MPKDFKRVERVAQEMQIQLSKLILNEVKDPRLGVVTITSVDVTRDFAHAKIYIVVRDPKSAEISVDILNKAAGFLRRQLGKAMTLRFMPELHFHYDNSSVYGQHIDELLKNVKTDDESSSSE